MEHRDVSSSEGSLSFLKTLIISYYNSINIYFLNYILIIVIINDACAHLYMC